MDVVGHQHPSEAAESELGSQRVQPLEEINAVVITERDPAALEAADHHVVVGAGCVESRRACDGGVLAGTVGVGRES